MTRFSHFSHALVVSFLPFDLSVHQVSKLILCKTLWSVSMDIYVLLEATTVPYGVISCPCEIPQLTSEPLHVYVLHPLE